MPKSNNGKTKAMKNIKNQQNEVKDEFSYLRFIEDNLPGYDSDDRVLGCDILFRYLAGEDVSDDDLEEIHRDFANKSEVLEELKRMEVQLFSESLDNFYSEYWK